MANEFNQFTEAFDKAVNAGDVDAATDAMVGYLQEHSKVTGKPMDESFSITRAWMGYDMGENREASTRNTPDGKKAIEQAQAKLGIQLPAGM